MNSVTSIRKHFAGYVRVIQTAGTAVCFMVALCLWLSTATSDSFYPATTQVLAERDLPTSRINFPQPNKPTPKGLDAGTAAMSAAESVNNQTNNIMKKVHCRPIGNESGPN